MSVNKKCKILIIVFILPLLISCSMLDIDTSTGENSDEDNIVQGNGESGFGAIIFCEAVTDDGVIVGANNVFSDGTDEVWAYFNYWGMKKGQPWGRIWTHNGQEYINASGEIWEDIDEGWVAYSIGGSYNLEPGEYEFTLLIDGQPVQRSSFQILGE